MSCWATSAGTSGFTLNETDTARSVLQNVEIILGTWQGVCPLYREFGLATEYVDKPVNVARAMLYAEVKEAVEQYEPRARVKDVRVSEDLSAPGRLTVRVEVDIVGEKS